MLLIAMPLLLVAYCYYKSSLQQTNQVDALAPCRRSSTMFRFRMLGKTFARTELWEFDTDADVEIRASTVGARAKATVQTSKEKVKTR